jgi:hypothetical protein
MNGFFKINDKYVLNLTIARFADVTGNEYIEEYIKPPISI